MRSSNAPHDAIRQPQRDDPPPADASPDVFPDLFWIRFATPDPDRYALLCDLIHALRRLMIEQWNQYADWVLQANELGVSRGFWLADEQRESLLSRLRSYLTNVQAYSLLERPLERALIQEDMESPQQSPGEAIQQDGVSGDEDDEDDELFAPTFADILEYVYWIPLGLVSEGNVALLEYVPIEANHPSLISEALHGVGFPILESGDAKWEHVRSTPWPLVDDSVDQWTQDSLISLLLGERKADPHERARLWTVCGHSARRNQHLVQAKTAYEQALALDPSFLAAWHGLTDALYLLEDWQNAVNAARRVTELAPDNAANWADLAEMQCNAKQFDAAHLSSVRAIQLDSQSAPAWTVTGWALHRLGKFEESVAACQRALELSNHRMGGAWVTLTGALDDLGRYEEALAASDMAIKWHGGTVAWSNRGVALWGLERYEEALTACERALDKDPESALGWINLGVTLFKLDRIDEALAAYQRACDLDPAHIKAWFNLALAHRKLSQDEDALTACARALALDANYASAWDLQALSLQRLGRLEEARIASERAVTLEPSSVSYWITHTQVLEARGSFDELLLASQRLTALDPDRVIGWLRLALALLRIGRYEEALSAANHVIERNPKSVLGYCFVGEAYAHLGSYVQARDAYRAAQTLDATNLDAALGLGWSYERLSQIDSAVATYREALRLHPTSEIALDALVKLLVSQGFHNLAEEARAQYTETSGDAPSSQAGSNLE